jgi:hypothetical protein
MKVMQPDDLVDKSSDLAATIEFRADHQGGAEPWGRSTMLQLDSNGFRQDRQLGRGAEAEVTLGVRRVRGLLLDQYDRQALITLLDHFVQLRASLDDG